MSIGLSQHQIEIERNRQAWERKPLLRAIYESFYARILPLIDRAVPGRIVEIGSGIGNLKSHLPSSISTDLFPNPWLDAVCDTYELPFASKSLSHLILFDVFHHLQAPNMFLIEARRVLAPGGRVLLFEPFISLSSWPAYGCLHHEPVAWRKAIDLADSLARPRMYYAAQGNATRLFFEEQISGWPAHWEIFHREAFACFSYLLSGGFSRPAFYPAFFLGCLQRADHWLSRFPKLFGARCLVGLRCGGEVVFGGNAHA